MHHSEAETLDICLTLPFEEAELLLFLLARGSRKTSTLAALESLAKRSWILRAALALNPATAPDTLLQLGTLKGVLEGDTRLFVARNRSTPAAVLEAMAADPELREVEQESAKRTLSKFVATGD